MRAGKWTNEDIDCLKKFYAVEGPTYCTKILNRSVKAVMHKAMRLGIATDRGRAKKVLLERDQIEDLIVMFKNNNSIKEICLKTGRSTKVIRRYIKELGLKRIAPRNKKIRYCSRCGKELKHEIRTNYCSAACKSKHNHCEWIALWKGGKIGNHTEQIPGAIRRYLHEKYGGACEECGWNKTNISTGRVPLTVHHIDGNSSNNDESNLQLLCPNCHSLKPNYGSLNKGNGRTKRNLKIQKLNELLKQNKDMLGP